MKFKKFQKILIDLKFAILLSITIAILSSIGSVIEQDQTEEFYKENYSSVKPLYGFITSEIILKLGIDHLYTSWWFLSLLVLLSCSLIFCTIIRQFPLVINSKNYIFKRKFKKTISIFIKLKDFYYLNELILSKLKNLDYYLYQKKNFLYGYKGLIGRISPILVHFSLIFIFIGSSIGAFENLKDQEIIPKDEIIHVQNPIKIGGLNKIPKIAIRLNDFWIEYKNNKISQFYSNLSIVDFNGNEILKKTISVNNPLKYNGLNIYQSDWNLTGIRIELNTKEKKIEYPLFYFNKEKKIWITWVKTPEKTYTLIFDELKDSFFIYSKNGNFLRKQKINELNSFNIIEILPSTGLLIKYDKSINIIYSGFLGLIGTTILSYLPYNQIWIIKKKQRIWIISDSNRGILSLEIEFENFIRKLEKELKNSKFQKLIK